MSAYWACEVGHLAAASCQSKQHLVLIQQGMTIHAEVTADAGAAVAAAAMQVEHASHAAETLRWQTAVFDVAGNADLVVSTICHAQPINR